MKSVRGVVATAALLAAAVTFAACSDDDDGDLRTFFGPLSGGDEIVGVLTTEDTVQAYVCDGREVGEFFEGPRAGDQIGLNSDGGARLDAVIGDDQVTGTFQDGGAPRSFTAPANPNSGIYLVTASPDGANDGTSLGGGELHYRIGPDGTIQPGGLIQYPQGGTRVPFGRIAYSQAGEEIDLSDQADVAGQYRFTLFDGGLVGGETRSSLGGSETQRKFSCCRTSGP